MLADLAIGRTRAARKLADLSMALASGFTGHHALLCRLHRDRPMSPVSVFPAVSLAAHSIVLATICGRGRFGIWDQ